MKTRTLRFSAISAAVIAAALAGELRADTIDFTGEVFSLFHVNKSNFTNATMWAGDTPSAGNDYRIVGSSSSQQRYCGLGVDGSWIFPGDSLRIGQYGNLVHVNSGDCEFPRDGLCLDGGSKIWAYGWKTTPTLSGAVTVGDGATASIYGYQSTDSLTFNGSFTGDVGSKLIVRNEEPGYQDSNNKSYTNKDFGVFFKGDMTGYKGTIEVGVASGKWAGVYFGATHVDGKVQINATGTVGPCAAGMAFGECSVSNLVLAAGATMKLGVNNTTCGIVRVTHVLALPESGKVTIDLSSTPSGVWHTQLKRPLLIAPLGTGLSAETFEVSLPSGFYTENWTAAFASLVVKTTEDSEILMWEDHARCNMAKTDGNGQSAFLPECASHWTGLSNGNALNPEMPYFVGRINNSDGNAIRSPNLATGIAEFGGWGLAISGANYFYLYQSAKVDRLFVRPDSRIVSVNSTATKTLQGTLTVVDYTGSTDYAKFYAPDNKPFNIQSELRGTGSILLTTDADTSRFPGDGNAVFQLDGTNALFAGRIRVSNATPPTYVTTLKVADGRNLGGALPAFAYNGVELSAGSRLDATDSLELSESTRGLFVNGTGRIRITDAGDVMTLYSRLTMAGTLVKEGSGTLALGGTVKFTTAQLDTPLTGTNVLEIVEGRIRPASKGGADGLSISFASGTGLRLAPFAETDDDVLRYGLYNVKTDTPFNLTATGGKLNVALDLPVNIDELPREFSFSVCTVSSAAASALQGNIILSKIKGYGAKFESVSNGDGTVTFKATCGRTGFVLSYR